MPSRASRYLSVGPVAFEGEAPTGGARTGRVEAGACIERDMGACLRGDPPARERAWDFRLSVAGEEEARRSCGAGGKAEAPGGKRGFDFGLGQARDQRGAFQPLFQRPGGLVRVARLDDKDTRRVEPRFDEAGTVGAPPFLGLPLRHAPQHQSRALPLDLGDHGKGKSKACGRVAIGMGFDLVQAALVQRAQRTLHRRAVRRGAFCRGVRCVGGRG